MTRDEVLAEITAARTEGRWADLRWANLYGADLRRADLYGADLRGVIGGIFTVQGLPSGDVVHVPTPAGWVLQHVGCWGTGTTDDLRALIAGEDWPGADTAAERDRRRPSLALVADLCDAHAAARPDIVPDLAAEWGAA